jgi:hypothetical protein
MVTGWLAGSFTAVAASMNGVALSSSARINAPSSAAAEAAMHKARAPASAQPILMSPPQAVPATIGAFRKGWNR